MNQNQYAAMKEGGQILGQLLIDLKNYVQIGMTKRSVDAWVRQEIIKRGAIVAYDLLPQKFPGSICISVNDELVHGAPNNDYAFEDGDKVSFDLVILYQGFYVDSAFTIALGKASPAIKNLIKTTEKALWAGIDQVRPGAHIGDIGHAVETVLRQGKLGVIENYIGHGIGKTMHQAPEVPNYGHKNQGYILKPGDYICIEPMSSLGKPHNHVSKENGWDVILSDGSVGCHCEHTVLVTENGFEVLTLPNCPRP